MPSDFLHDSEITHYKQLLGTKQQRLSFPEETEKNYQAHQKRSFLKTNKRLVAFGVFFYLSFLIVDYFFYPDIFVPLAIVRLVIGLVAVISLFYVFFHRNYQHVIGVTLYCGILMGLQVLLCAHLFFDNQPYDILYAIGVLPIIVFGIIVFRFCFKELLIYVSVLFCGILVVIQQSYPFTQMEENALLLFSQTLPIMMMFIAAICMMGLYMSYAVDKLSRHDWLKNNILQLESIKLNQLNDQLEKLSITDGLTNLYNRRFFDQRLRDYWQVSKNNNQPLSLIMLDVDWFKAYNDHYGHQQGDVFLKQMSDCLKQHCSRNQSLIARYGGEEFIILLPNTSAHEANRLAQSLCDAIFALKIKHANSPFKFGTVSLGVDTKYPAETPYADYENSSGILRFLQHVDKALYEAKARGKNCVAVYHD